MGSYKIRCKKQPTSEYKGATVTDPAAGRLEMKHIDDIHTTTFANIVEQEWLSIYLWLTQTT